jgi:hypothetical protein
MSGMETQHDGFSLASGDVPVEDYVDDVPADRAPGGAPQHQHHAPPEDQEDETALLAQSSGDTPADLYIDE